MNQPQPEAVAIGASAGALDALSQLLSALPKDFPLALMVVVHRPASRDSMLTELLGARCRIAVREAEDKEPIRPATAYFAPADYHLLVEADKRLSLSSEEPVNYSRPAIDLLLSSAAEAYGAALIGMVLTGASSDGAQGLRAVEDAGGTALVQRPDTAYAPNMPRAALDACVGARALTLSELASYLLEVAPAS
ncbi:MAG TPA: chemotaxis protein CheB [Pirellulales bacterium]|jgi:two-component system chemotaxis response regulator CheB|nr:chemotaxis protein CheB [Pirellulales bacterium]